MTTEQNTPDSPAVGIPVDWRVRPGAGAQCWCHTCRPITFAAMIMIVCPECGDKRCIHAFSHAAPCAKSNLYEHNLWVERMALRVQAAPENSAPDEVAIISLGAALRPNIMWTNQSNSSRLAYVVLCSWACHAPSPVWGPVLPSFG